MCGRYTHLYTWKQLHRLMELTTPLVDLPMRYNVAPTQRAPVVRQSRANARTLDMLRWGLVPSWAKDLAVGSSMINARGETIASKPAFRAAFKRRRCIVPISGFYEWQKLGGTRKQPHYITASDDQPLALAGLWESWLSPEQESIETYTIVTTTPNEMMAEIHDRMPVILHAEDLDAWLDPGDEGSARVAGLIRPYPAELMLARPVSTHVNSPRHDDPSCIQTLGGGLFTGND